MAGGTSVRFVESALTDAAGRPGREGRTKRMPAVDDFDRRHE
jgi:hypothetical protein